MIQRRLHLAHYPNVLFPLIKINTKHLQKDSQHGVWKETMTPAEKVNLVNLTEVRDTQEIHRAHFWVYLSGHFQKLACGTASQRDLP